MTLSSASEIIFLKEKCYRLKRINNEYSAEKTAGFFSWFPLTGYCWNFSGKNKEILIVLDEWAGKSRCGKINIPKRKQVIDAFFRQHADLNDRDRLSHS